MEHIKCLKQSFKIFKSEVLKAASFKRWNETVFQNFCGASWLSKMFKNMSALTQFWTLCFLSFVAECIEKSWFISTTLSVFNVTEADSNVFQSLGARL